MRIKTSIQVTPATNSVLSVIKFAWLPHRIGDIKVWLSRYEVLFIYEVRKVKTIINQQPMEFEVSNWTKISERLL